MVGPAKDKVKIAVAGCGRVALDIHLPILARLRDVAVVAVIDPEPTRLALAKQLHPRARCFSVMEQLWSSGDVDALIIAAPTALHTTIAMGAMRHGKSIYLEKPIGVDLEEASTLVEAYRSKRIVGMIGFNYRFNPLLESARSRIRDGIAGRPLIVSTVFTSSFSIRSGWRESRQEGGGVLLDLASHHVDLIHFLLDDEVVQVRAQIASTYSEDGTASIQMKLRSGTLVNSSFSFGTVDQDRIEIFGDKALLRLDRYLSTDCEIIPLVRQAARMRQIRSALSFLWRPNVIVKRHKAPGHDVSYSIALKRFVEAVKNGKHASPDLNDGYKALSVLRSAEESAKQNDWVNVPAFT